MIPLHYVNTLLTLPLSVIQFDLIAEATTVLQDDLSSTLRGAIGWSLSEVGCLGECEWIEGHGRRKERGKRYPTKRPQDAKSEEQKSKFCDVPRCPYARSFLGSGWPEAGLRVHPSAYRICGPNYLEPREYLAGDELSFTLTLFGEGVAYAPYWIAAIIRAAARGLTHSRAPFYLSLATDLVTGEHLYRRDRAYPPLPSTLTTLDKLIPPFEDQAKATEIRLEVNTPLLLKNVSSHPPLSALTRAILRRSHALYNRFVGPLEHPLSGDEVDWLSQADVTGEFVRHEQHRYSTSHRGKVPQTGGVGVLIYSNITAWEWTYTLLKIGEHLGVGQQANMGLGRYKIELLS